MSPRSAILAPSGSHRHPDRDGLPPWLHVAIVGAACVAVGVAGQLVARNRLSPAAGFVAGVVVALLAVVGLPSLSLRFTARAAVGISTVLLVRFGLLGGGSLVGGGQALVAWLVAATAVLVLSDRVGTEAQPPLGGPVPGAVASRPGPSVRTIAVVALLVVAFAVALSPYVVPRVGGRTEAGRGAALGATGPGQSLRATGRLDMTTRPELTDDVVFTVEADRGTFWRGETFDRWDGRNWTRSDPRLSRVGEAGTIVHGPDDLGARGNDIVVQRVRMQAEYADVLYAAASADRVELDRPAAQHPDGTLIVAPMGPGATYTVTSRRIAVTEEDLRAASGQPIPAAVRQQYAQPPQATDRVLAAARRVTRNATTDYDRIRALEAWMGRRTEYSLKAPLAPAGVDVVDHFLFTSRRGWCEQVASSLVVLARANGIPARLVTGFVPGEQDPITGTWTVRAKDAHAWAEVWFAGIGWVPFDPTASVPLAGDDRSTGTWQSWLLRNWLYLVLAVAVVAVAAGPLRARLRRRRAARTLRRRSGWALAADRALDRLGARADRARGPGETAVAYARVLAERYGDERLVAVGRTVDDALYAPDPPGPERCAAADAVLAEVEESRPAAEPVA